MADSSSPARSIGLSASGVGTTIVTEPDMASTPIQLGAHFAGTPIVRTFKVINRGRRHQSLVWSCERGNGTSKQTSLTTSGKRSRTKFTDARDMKVRVSGPGTQRGFSVLKQSMPVQ